MAKIVSHDSEVPAVGQQVITACACIHHKFDGVEKIFLPKRAASKKFLPSVYEFPGGHINFGEEITNGLTREIEEELGMKIKIGDPFYVFTYMNKIKGSHSIEVIYLATFISPVDQLKLNPEDHSEYVWVAENEIEATAGKNKGQKDPEVKALYKAFQLLKQKN